MFSQMISEALKPLYAFAYLCIAGLIVLLVSFFILKSLFLAIGMKKNRALLFAKELAIISMAIFILGGYYWAFL